MNTIKFYTFAEMEQATVKAASTENYSGYPKENVLGYDHNFYWEGSTGTDPHIYLDLGSHKKVDCILGIYPNFATIDEFTFILYYSDDYITWTYVPPNLTWPSRSTPFNIKEIVYERGLTPHRYWRIKHYNAEGYSERFKVSGLWLGKTHIIKAQHAIEDDIQTYPTKFVKLPYNKQFKMGLNRNKTSTFSRTYTLTIAQWKVLKDVHRLCKGTLRPLLIKENDAAVKLVKFVDDEINENQILQDLFRPTVRFFELPYIRSNGFY